MADPDTLENARDRTHGLIRAADALRDRIRSEYPDRYQLRDACLKEGIGVGDHAGPVRSAGAHADLAVERVGEAIDQLRFSLARIHTLQDLAREAARP